MLLRSVERRRLRWVDLDLDLHLDGDDIEVRDASQFHERAASLGYPSEVIDGAWRGATWLAPRYTNGEWPFDGWLESAWEALDSREIELRKAAGD
jgi:hypothetical protein